MPQSRTQLIQDTQTDDRPNEVTITRTVLTVERVYIYLSNEDFKRVDETGEWEAEDVLESYSKREGRDYSWLFGQELDIDEEKYEITDVLSY